MFQLQSQKSNRMTEINGLQKPGQRIIPSLRSNFAWTFAGNMLYASCQWGMLSVLAKLGSATIVGQFTLGLAVSAPIFMFTNLQLRAVQASDVNREHGFADYFTLRLIATSLGLVVLAGILFFMDVPAMVKLVILLVSVSKTFECMSDVTAGLLQREEQLRRVAISLMIRGSASVIAFSFIFARFRNLSLAVGSMCMVWLSVMVFYDLRNARAIVGPHESFIRFDRKVLWKLTWLGLPLGWVTTFTSLNANIPRYFLEHQRGLAEQGIYASLAYIVIAINLIAAALSQSATTRLAHFFAAGDLKQFVHLLRKLCTLGIIIPVVGVPVALTLGKPLLTLLYRKEYAEHTDLLALIMVTAGFNTVMAFLFCGMNAARRYRALVPAYLAGVLTGVVGSALLIPHFGLFGAGIAMLLSAIVTVIGILHALRKAIRERAALPDCGQMQPEAIQG
jgi:O-antigen/teichoic acid export membrane protein